MKIICIDDFGNDTLFHHNLTKGKIYDDIPTYPNSEYLIIDDVGRRRYYLKSKFITLEEYRNKRLDELFNIL